MSILSLLSVGLVALSSVHAQQVWDVTVGGPNGETVFNPTTVVSGIAAKFVLLG